MPIILIMKPQKKPYSLNDISKLERTLFFISDFNLEMKYLRAIINNPVYYPQNIADNSLVADVFGPKKYRKSH